MIMVLSYGLLDGSLHFSRSFESFTRSIFALQLRFSTRSKVTACNHAEEGGKQSVAGYTHSFTFSAYLSSCLHYILLNQS